MRYTRMHGCRNTFLVVDERNGPRVDDPGERAIRLCGQDGGAFADGILYLHPTPRGAAKMVLYNADGSPGAMCGNGIRCVGKYLIERDRGRCRLLLSANAGAALALAVRRPSTDWPTLVGEALSAAATLLPAGGPVEVRRVDVDTPAGLRILYGLSSAGVVRFVTVDLGAPTLRRKDLACTLPGDEVIDRPVEVGGRDYVITCVSTGNVHAVIFVRDVEEVDVRRVGPLLERAPFFPDRANIHFVQVLSESRLRMRNWERGAGETQACGTGACAATVAAAITHRAGKSCLVSQPGGDVLIHLGETALLTGPAEFMEDGDG